VNPTVLSDMLDNMLGDGVGQRVGRIVATRVGQQISPNMLDNTLSNTGGYSGCPTCWTTCWTTRKCPSNEFDIFSNTPPNKHQKCTIQATIVFHFLYSGVFEGAEPESAFNFFNSATNNVVTATSTKKLKKIVALIRMTICVPKTVHLLS
jgi:hypothetical protein